MPAYHLPPLVRIYARGIQQIKVGAYVPLIMPLFLQSKAFHTLAAEKVVSATTDKGQAARVGLGMASRLPPLVKAFTRSRLR